MAARSMKDLAISVLADPARALTFDVVVRDAGGESRHRVAFGADDAARWARLGASPSRGVEAAMRFLLDREAKESILGAFDIDVIRRYFPDFDDAFPGYLARPGGPPGRSA
jgi:hypothetical protein